MGFRGGSVVKNPPPNAGDAGSIPGSGIELGSAALGGGFFTTETLGKP